MFLLMILDPFACLSVEMTKITLPSGPASASYVGVSTSSSGDYVVYGADGEDAPLDQQGAAYVYFRSGTSWNQQAKLTASDGADFDRFGNSVSIDGDYVLVGAWIDEVGAAINGGSAFR